jgi:hypothetical protein
MKAGGKPPQASFLVILPVFPPPNRGGREISGFLINKPPIDQADGSVETPDESSHSKIQDPT